MHVRDLSRGDRPFERVPSVGNPEPLPFFILPYRREEAVLPSIGSSPWPRVDGHTAVAGYVAGVRRPASGCRGIFSVVEEFTRPNSLGGEHDRVGIGVAA